MHEGRRAGDGETVQTAMYLLHVLGSESNPQNSYFKKYSRYGYVILGLGRQRQILEAHWPNLLVELQANERP